MPARTLETTTACECPEAGRCHRHGCEKSALLHYLCRTDVEAFQSWEDGHGPGQPGFVPYQGAVDDSQRSLMHPLFKRVWNLAGSLVNFVADGCRTVSAAEYEQRLKICDACPRRDEGICLECGCYLAVKAKGRAMQCPLGRWPPAGETADPNSKTAATTDAS